MSRLYLHIGYPKTGTTTLQRAFFDPLFRHGSIRYLGMFGFEAGEADPRKAFFSSLTRAMYVEDDEFVRTLGALQASFRALSAGTDLPVVLSNEHLVQSQWSTTVAGQRIVPARTAQRLAAVFGGTEVSLLLCVRRQDALLRSMFLENLSRPNHGNGRMYRSLDEYLARSLDPQDFHSRFIDFAGVLDAYEAAFPGAAVLPWTFEDFRDDQPGVLSRLSDFLTLGPRVPSCIQQPLEQQNAKSKGGGPVDLPSWSRVHRALYAFPGGPTLASAVKRSPWLAALSDRMKSNVRVRGLTDDEVRQVMARCHPLNARLAVKLPALAPSLRRAGYLAPSEGPAADHSNPGAAG